jgi:hypothetical protein
VGKTFATAILSGAQSCLFAVTDILLMLLNRRQSACIFGRSACIILGVQRFVALALSPNKE